jgi:hypothetical protein
VVKSFLPVLISVHPRKSAVKVFAFQFSLLAISAILAILFSRFCLSDSGFLFFVFLRVLCG